MNCKWLFVFAAFVWLSCKNANQSGPDITQPSTLMCAPPLVDAEWYTQNTPAPLLEGMDKLHYPITTNSDEAQKYFNQGLLLAYAFNHAEAARSFYQAIRMDSTCAMCYWGFAYVLGPNYNASMEPDNYARAYDAIQKANALASSVTAKEKALIKAMTARYTKDVPENRYHLDSAYMLEMRTVHQLYPADVDIAAMYAESLMDMHPWDLWTKDEQPRPWTMDILKSIDVAIGLDPKHPGGHHFNIHAWEASGTPEKAIPSARVFDEGLVAHAGHLVHMPSHIYINTGDYFLGSIANINAVKVDSTYVTQCHAQGAYPLAYYPHNYHFLAATATLHGHKTWAVMAAKKMEEQSRHKGMLIPELATLQHYNSIPYFIYVKFGMWDEILAYPGLDTMPVYLHGIRHYARGMAYVGKKDITKAREELISLQQIAADDTLKALSIWGINSLFSVIDIGQKVLEGEILALEKKYDESIAMLSEAAALEDQLNYNEPPDWFFSVRHHLGAVQLEAGKAKEAVATYETDLKTFPRNGWALNGLHQAYVKLDDPEKAAQAESQFQEAWKHADTKLISSRLW
jgi:tetratricopeptide (TPR) repeat protein